MLFREKEEIKYFISSKLIIIILLLIIHLVINITSILVQNCSCFSCSNFSDLYLSFPVFNSTCKNLVLILLLNELKRIRHVLNLLLKSSLLSIVHISLFDFLFCLLDSFISELFLVLINTHSLTCQLLLFQCLTELFL